MAVMRGEKHYNAKLSNDDVRLIRELAMQRNAILKEARKISNSAIANKFDVSRRTIEAIIGRTKRVMM